MELVNGFDNARAAPWGSDPGTFCTFPKSAPQNPEAYAPVADYGKRIRTAQSTGTSVIAVKYNKGVIIAADTLASYGSLARFKNCPRLVKLNENTVVGASGDYADFQYVKELMERKITEEVCLEDGIKIKPREMHSWLTRVLYKRRSNLEPILNTFVVAGMQDAETPFLGAIDKIGTAYEDVCVGTGLGSHIAVPLIREITDRHNDSPIRLDETKARELIRKCMNVLYYRDARSHPRYQIAVIDGKGSRIDSVVEVEPDWSIAELIEGY